MKNCILLLVLLCNYLLVGQTNLIENPGFESGPVSWSYNQLHHATGWTMGCRQQFLDVDWCSPDLYDINGNQSCFVEKGLYPRDNGSLNERYAHMFNKSTDPITGESIKATIIEPLSEDYSYEVSCYVSREINVHDDDDGEYNAPLQLEFVLRNNDDCDLEKIVHTSTNIAAVFNYDSCDNAPDTPSTDWRQKLGNFNLDAGDISNNYNKLEIRIKGKATVLDPIFIDDVKLIKIPKVKACFEINNVDSAHTEQSDYGPKTVNELCLPKIEINGSCSTNEDGYHIRISEFSLSPWTIVTDYYNGWVASGTAPSTIDLNNLISVPSANNGWTSHTFDPTKLYAVSLSVGPIWDSAPFQFFRVKDCRKIEACFEIKNVDSAHTEQSDYGPKTVNELCLPKIEIDGSCSIGEDGYHIRISEFSLSPWTIVTDYYNGWVASGTAPSTIDLNNLISVPSANNGWTSHTFDPTKLYAVSLSVGPIWDSAPFQFFRVKDCREIEACFEIKNVDSVHTEESDYGPKTVNELCLPKIEIDGSCSTNEEGYHIRISEFSLSPWTIVTDYYDGWVGPGTAPSTINLNSLISIPSANNGWTSHTFDPAKLYAVSLSVGPVWDSAPFQFFRVKGCRIQTNDIEENSVLNIYPNPTIDYINFSFNKQETGTIQVYRFDSRLMYTELFNEAESLRIDMRNYKKGIYIVRVTTGTSNEVYKIIKK
ncbi:T9SS type A sorting domain-containing protein [Dokdonia ponticola]|uniref:T9SS type A sorting domain-containing protein n=1 Tax=Dokdonia ponticola TaxID=2041041 RepID=A0ABV9I1E6_9FLAO